ncbi:tryptophan 7-halogenase [Saccharophagus sp. K07]|uniref:tryptophan halogenase family protein n=1 Tax=Saccharophagus sp. K07 TaxID=2283636 RepID=UPI0016529A25|nr:tryptophan halogenase family protein [Saccharophagus sp. K07]MBC6905383.1 tryptophan 7-halogenase [Saccharophagus sp. K07]
MIQKLVIVGGGTAGWMTAAAFCHLFQDSPLQITLVESDAIGTVGVGEATIPHLRYFNERLGINEHEFMRATNATFKLGIMFSDWRKPGHSYIHPFGEFGFATSHGPFYHYWSRAHQLGLELAADEFSIATHMARLGRFTYPSQNDSELLSTFSYAFHIDAARYAVFLRQYCEKTFRNFSRQEGKIEHVLQDSSSGDITGIKLDSGLAIDGDFFIDCSGFSSLLLNKTLGAKPLDMSEYLPCNSAIAVPTDETYPDVPFSRATAHAAGWQWRIPLRHRTGNGCVYSTNFMSDSEAEELFHKNLAGNKLADLNLIRFSARRMDASWKNNCVAIGLSSGFLEPLESTSIHLIQVAIMKLTELLPNGKDWRVERDEFNRQMTDEYEKIRDFLVLHYHVTEREDSEFWRYIKNMPLPSSLEQRMNLIQEAGIIDTYQHGLFLESSWAYVYFCQGGQSNASHHRTHHLSDQELLEHLRKFHAEIAKTAQSIGKQSDMLNRIYGGGEVEKWPQSAMSLYGVFS